MNRRSIPLLVFAVGLLLAACGEQCMVTPLPVPPPSEAAPTATATSRPSRAPTSPSAPSLTATPRVLGKSTYRSSEFDPAPDLAERMPPIVEPDRIRGTIDTLSNQPDETTVHAGGDTYHLRGADFDEADHGRIVLLQGQFDEQDGRIFRVQAYESVPFAVLTGRLRVEELCRMECDDWLLLDVEQGGQTYTFGWPGIETSIQS